MEQYPYKENLFMNKKPDHTMVYIAGSVILLVAAIAATSIINNRPSTEADIRAKASLQTGVVYEAIVRSVDAGTGVVTVESLKPKDKGMTLSGIWTVQLPTAVSLSGISTGTNVQITVDSKTFDIQNRTMSAKKVEVK
jgi:hypothetical protein